MFSSSYHQPVMVAGVLRFLACKPGGVYVDGTVGGGGHAAAILEATAPDGRLIGIDLDDEALAETEERLKNFGTRKVLRKGNFADMKIILSDLGVEKVDGILLDLGVSSHQFDTAERGFSFTADAPLDMRMDRTQGVTAADLVNRLSEQELRKVIRDYGEDVMAGRIAKAVVARRRKAPILTTRELAGIVSSVVPASMRYGRINPATRTFQALRIAVNDELTNLHMAIQSSTELLEEEGRVVIISFHSLEDRMVKTFFRSWEKGCLCPPDFPRCTCGGETRLRVLTRKPVVPDEAEVSANPRARSAKLRAAERIQN